MVLNDIDKTFPQIIAMFALDFLEARPADHWSRDPEESMEDDESGDVFNILYLEFVTWLQEEKWR